MRFWKYLANVIFCLVIISIKAFSQMDTLRFIDGTYYVIDSAGYVIFPIKARIDNKESFQFVNEEAEFPGGRQAFTKRLGGNIKADHSLKKAVVISAIFTISNRGLPVSIVAQGDTSNGRGKQVRDLIKR